ncbi:MAG: pantetheine-phosphate adenylyltransferase [Magnetococcales bacterium]|nr:pantetheine-phosphate adenylyltransferase [Magnetococcales bacterium]
MAVAVYPGTFDPLTLGHLDVIQRSAALFDRLVVGVAVNIEKKALFSAQERVRLIHDAVVHLPNVTVGCIEGLLVDYVRQQGARAIVRGLRAMSDFENELQMAAMNRKLDGAIETVFLMASETTTFISSRLVKEIARMGGDVTPFVPTNVIAQLTERMQSQE